MSQPNPEQQQKYQQWILSLLPSDHSFVGNASLQQQVAAAAGQAIDQQAFMAARDALVASGQVVKGKGRGGSSARATGGIGSSSRVSPRFSACRCRLMRS